MPRSTKNPGIFAGDANTTIPPTPVVGVSYRDAANGLDNIRDGWPFKEIVNSPEFAQILHELTSLTDLIDRTGVLEYKDDVEYDIVPAFVQGSNGEIYKSLIANGPATTVVDPVGDATGTWVLFASSKTGQVKTTVLTSSDAAWVPDPLTRAIEFTVVGGGGGGGAADGQGATTGGAASGGAGAGTAIKTSTVIDASYNITIGAGGAGGTGSSGGTGGGQSSVVSTSLNVTANGGSGGAGDLAQAGDGTASGQVGGTAAGGDINLRGGSSETARVVAGSPACLGQSGASFLGGQTRTVSVNNDGVNASTPGAGGSGGSTQDSATNRSGGNGFRGVVIIKEFF